LARRALIVGINHYDNLPGSSLQGAIPDALAVETAISRHHDGSPNYACRVLISSLDSPVSRPVLRDELNNLFRSANDEVVFYFSGHGSVTANGGYIVTQDAQLNDIGFPMDEILNLANAAREREVIIVLDCCMSGSMGNPQVLQGDGSYQRSYLDQNVTILAASRHNEMSMEISGQGIFTSLLVDALEGGAADMQGKVTLPSIYAHIEGALGAWEQRPIFKTYTTEVSVIRNAEPKIDAAVLRKLPTIFPSAESLLQLDPSYEYDKIPVTENQLTGWALKKYRDVGLLQIHSDHTDLFWAAEECGTVKLTRLGRHYWRLANGGRI